MRPSPDRECARLRTSVPAAPVKAARTADPRTPDAPVIHVSIFVDEFGEELPVMTTLNTILDRSSSRSDLGPAVYMNAGDHVMPPLCRGAALIST